MLHEGIKLQIYDLEIWEFGDLEIEKIGIHSPLITRREKV